MFNHARTLLLNISGSTAPGVNYPWEEAVPEDFRSFSPSASLAAVRGLLFGTAPDRALLNYRLKQYLTLLHATELKEHVLALDMRVTYLPIRDTTTSVLIKETVTQTAGAKKAFYVIGTSTPATNENRLLRDWVVEVINTEEVKIQLDSPRTSEIRKSTITNGLSDLLPLTGSPLSFYFESGVGSSWDIRSLVKPSRGLPDIVSSIETSAAYDDLDYLFGPAPAEPYATFRALWRDHPWLAYKLGGLLLAVIYRSNEEWLAEENV